MICNGQFGYKVKYFMRFVCKYRRLTPFSPHISQTTAAIDMQPLSLVVGEIQADTRPFLYMYIRLDQFIYRNTLNSNITSSVPCYSNITNSIPHYLITSDHYNHSLVHNNQHLFADHHLIFITASASASFQKSSFSRTIRSPSHALCLLNIWLL